LATDPPIIVADEPTGNLDSRSADVVIRVFQELAAQGKTILIVTHDPSLTSRTDRTVIIADGEIVDPIVAGALPMLDHSHMLQATHALQRKHYRPGETIIRRGEPVSCFYMIGSGKVDVWDGNLALSIAQLSPHQFFGEVELLSGKPAIATIRAGAAPVELATVPKELFSAMMHESPAASAVLGEVADARRQENLARSQPGRRL
jgi:putative ABC transport system ATP-binding protein